MKKLLLSFMVVAFSVTTYGQSSHSTEKCGTSYLTQKRLKDDPRLQQKQIEMERDMQNWIANESKNKSQAIITIPIVVHVLYADPSENISMAQIQSQIDVLNEDFRKLNADFSTVTPTQFQALAADCEIEFCLVDTDPQGNVSTGVTRTSVPGGFDVENNYHNSANGGHDSWDHTQYMNVWVGQLGDQLLGFATPPGTANANEDGVVIDVDAFGTVGLAAANPPNDLGRTAVHEVGHYLNLEHVWGGNAGGCSDDDFVADTPNQNEESSGCPTYPLTDACTPTGDGVMFVNYMDYSDDACLSMFTQGQKQRMLAAINTSRTGLLNTSLCGPSGNPIGLVESPSLEFNLSPNPASQFVVIDAQKDNPSPYTLQIINATGAIVFSKQMEESKEKIDLSRFRAGIYSVNISSANKAYTQLLIIE